MSDLLYLRNVTTIQRDASGTVTGITGPYGQSNTITLNANGSLGSITNANGETTSFTYTDKGLLTSAKSPGNTTPSVFTYDNKGRVLLTHDTQTMPGHAYERVRNMLLMPGVFVVPQGEAIGQIIEDLLLLAECSREEEWEGQVQYLPLK